MQMHLFCKKKLQESLKSKAEWQWQSATELKQFATDFWFQ